ncbi:MAG TPA: VWA domain-containing protein [Candidatus Acidoferrales bacterium]|nr:VWA domain-containing protein [Candidatus Acidoferrales bacterium]
MRNSSSTSSALFYGAFLVAAVLAIQLPCGPAPKRQQSSQSGEAPSTILVSFNFNVRDNHDHPIKSLSANQIHISVDGKEQTVESLIPVTPHPVSIVFLVDQSNSRRAGPRGTVYPELQPALDCFRRLLASGASVQVAEFDNEPKPEDGFSTTASELFNSMQKLARSEPGGATALFDSVAWASKQVAQRSGYRAIIVTTDGGDNLSRLNSQESIAEVQVAKASLYFVNLSRIERVENESLIRRETNTLTELARRAGGESLILDKFLGAKAIFDRIAEDIVTSYNVSFRLDSAKPQLELRSLKVTMDGDRLKVFAPSGTYALPH